jgi:hypothetical protein
MKVLASVVIGMSLVACGGGGGSDAPAPVLVPETPTPVIPPPPTVKVLSGSVVRYAAINTGMSFEVTIQPSFVPTGTLSAIASDTAGKVVAPVAVTKNADGSYSLVVDTVSALTVGHYKGDLSLKLCADSACATAQAVPSVTVPYDITVVAPGTAWPGDNLTALSAWPAVADWTNFQGNAGHTGYVPVDLKPDQFSLRWKNGPVVATNYYYGSNVISTIAISNGLFYASADLALKARKEFDGSLVWKYDVSTLAYPSINPPAVADGLVYMSAGQQSTAYLFGVDAASGTLRFKSPMASLYEVLMAPTAFGGSVYASGGSYGGLYGFKSTGDHLFVNTTLAQRSMWTPAVDASTVYAYVGDSLKLIDPATGAVLSTIKDNNAPTYSYQVNGSAVLASPGTVFAANYATASYSYGAGNELLKFNTAKGFIDFRIAGSYPMTPAYASGVVYAPNLNPYRLEARAESDGALQWTWTSPIAGDTTWTSEPLVTKNLVFISTTTATYAVDMRTHKTVWSYPATGRLALSQNGVLYISGLDALVAINLK